MTAGTHWLHAVLAVAAVAVWGQLLQVQAATMLQRLGDAVRLSARLAHLAIFQLWQLIQQGSTSIVSVPLGEVSQSQPHGLEEVLALAAASAALPPLQGGPSHLVAWSGSQTWCADW